MSPLVPARIRRGLPVYLMGSAVAVLGVGVRVHGHTQASRVDRWLDTHLTAGDPWRGLLSQVALLGSAKIAPLIGLALAGLCWRWRHRWAAAFCLLAPGLTDLLTNLVLKPTVGRTKVGSFAYPSGHTGRAVAVATVIFLLTADAGPAGRRWSRTACRTLRVAAAAGAVCVALAVVALGWHYASDAAAGALVATSVTLALATAMDRAKPRVERYFEGSKSSDKELMQ